MIVHFLFISLLSFLHPTDGTTETSSEKWKTFYGNLTKVMEDYNKNIAPFPDDGSPLEVRVAMIIVHLEILDSSAEFDLQISLIQWWKDPRLAIEGVDIHVLPDEFSDSIWTPGTSFQGPILLGNGNDDGGRVIELSEGGHIRSTNTMRVSFSFEYKLQRFPFDTQMLITHLTSPYSSDQLKFSWEHELHDPIVFNTAFGGYKQFRANGFRLLDVYITTLTSNTGSQSVSTAEMKIAIERDYLPFLLRVFSPITTLVLVSLLCLFIDPLRHPTPRIVVPAIALISTIFFVNQVSMRIPETPYIKAVDVWLGTCVSLTFAVLIESVIVVGSTDNADIGVSDVNEHLVPKKGQSRVSQGGRKGIDYFSRFLFPLAFVIFNITLIVLYM